MPVKTREISEAAAIHRAWEASLRTAIESGRTGGLDVKEVSRDDRCAFGKWLRKEGIETIITSNELLENLHSLHREFHIAVGQLLNLISCGKRDEALQMMGETGACTLVSRSLLSALDDIAMSDGHNNLL